ncbi:MAG TPA: 4-aminobutyrate--2-oxoglutarate transaminase [Povalibacter sp.]|nr:4-aminobutyrate--2-oxoglutarate transaminase [Povalibacter sp.]
MTTKSPSSSNADLLARRTAAVARGVATATPLFAQSAENSHIVDVEGRRYIDFASGIGVVATGHRHPRVMQAVQQQLERFTHTAFQVMAYDSYVELAERLNAIAPFKGPAKSVLFTTGAEAVENAIKIARIATRRSAVIAFSGAFHGRTLLTSSLTGKMVPYKQHAGASAPEIFRLPFPIDHRGIRVEDTLRSLNTLFYGDVEPSRVAAIILEPVQGEGGFYVAPPALLQALRKLCDTHGILLIADEIQSGFGRTGRMFAVEHSGVEPDLVTIAKSLAGGFPLSGVIGRAAIMDSVEPGGLGGTYAGSPLGCAAALAVLDAIRQEQLLERADAIGRIVRSHVERWSAAGAPVANLRGLGAMLAFDIVSRGSGEPDGPGAKRIVASALQAGLIALTCGTYGETIRILVPLTIDDAELKQGLEILGDAIAR